MKEIIKGFNLNERYILFFIYIYIFINWLLLFNVDILAPPDYYRYYPASEKLFSGDLKLGFIPPLFPFFLGLFGRILKLIGFSGDTFILGGRIISLFSGIGVVYFTHKLLKKFVYQFASIGTIFLIISPFFLKLLVLPLTDIFYLFFVSASIYFFSIEKFKFPHIWSFLGGLLTRFEGVLLIGSAFINYFDRKRKRWIYISISLIPITFILYFLFLKFARHLMTRINFVFSKGLFLNFFKHPMELVNLFYGNILYFISPKFPSFIKWIFFYLLLFAFFSGVYYLFKHRWQFVVSILFYLITFIIFKGYIQNIYPDIDFRRMLSPIWIFYVFVFIGLYHLTGKLKEFKKVYYSARILIYLFLLVSAFLLPIIKGNSVWIILLLLPVILVWVFSLKISKIKSILLCLILITFFGQLFFKSYKKSFQYLQAIPNKGAYETARWLNRGYLNGPLLAYTYISMMKYYLKKPYKIYSFYFSNEKIYRDRNVLLRALLKKIEAHNIRYVIIDRYFNKNRPYMDAVKKLLHKEKDNEENFKIYKILYHKGRYAATVLKFISHSLQK